MATIEFKGIEEYAKQLEALGKASEGICKYAIYDAAGLVADAIQKECPVNTGSLRDSVGISHFKNEDGFINVKIGFDGYDEKGVPNALKARAINKGRSNMEANPFVKRAVNRVKNQAQALIGAKLDEKIYSITGGK